MPVNTVTKNSRATNKQLAVLKQLYRFRFGTTDLLARSLDLKDGRYIHTRLEALIAQEYIGKNYDSSYKLDGKPATYYLLPKAFAVLRKQHKATGKELSEKRLGTSTKTKKPPVSSLLGSWRYLRSTTSYAPYTAKTSSSGRRIN